MAVEVVGTFEAAHPERLHVYEVSWRARHAMGAVGNVRAARAAGRHNPEPMVSRPLEPTSPPDVFVGFDPREPQAYRVCVASMRAHASRPLTIAPIVEPHVRAMGLYTRPHERRDGRLWDVLSAAPMSTEFALTRFLVPQLARSDWALFCDCDFLWRADVHRLFAQADPARAVLVVPHRQEVGSSVKMDGQVQTAYPRKNWSSLMLWNVRHPKHAVLPELMRTWPGRRLHGFEWLDDADIGFLPEAWNWLEGHSSPQIEPAAVHHTRGTPDMPDRKSVV